LGGNRQNWKRKQAPERQIRGCISFIFNILPISHLDAIFCGNDLAKVLILDILLKTGGRGVG
jgi:hypothetical protein